MCPRREALSVQWRWEFGSPRNLGQMDIWISKEGVPWGLREVGELSDRGGVPLEACGAA